MKGDKYLKNIINNLGENFATEWIYAGGDTDRHANYFRIFNKQKGLKPPPFAYECQCSHDIVEQCYIYNPKTKELRVMGNCCINKFVEKSGRTCERCGEPHKNRKDNYCNDCRPYVCPDCFRPKRAGYNQCYLCFINRFRNERSSTFGDGRRPVSDDDSDDD